MKVLVLHASGLHLGFLGCYGNWWVATPHLDRLAAQAVVFDQHYAQELTSRPLEFPCVVELLDQHGIAAEWVRGPRMAADEEGTTLEHGLDAALTSLEKLWGKDNWLCWVDLPSLKPPWDLAEELAGSYLMTSEDEEPWEPLLHPAPGPMDLGDLELWERLRCTYAAVVSYLDSGVGLLCEELRQHGCLEELCVVFTADQGLALGEHGMIGNVRPWLHEEIVHLPLVIYQPGAVNGGLRSSALTQPMDVTATLLELFQVDAPPTQGLSLMPLLRGDADTLRATCLSHWMVPGMEEWSLRTREWAFLLPAPSLSPRGPQLYAKPEDRWEMNNLVQHHQDLAEAMEKAIRGNA